MAGSWDTYFKQLLSHAAQDYATWLVDDALIEEELSPQLQITRNADTLYAMRINGARYGLHLEFQTRRDETMGQRLLEYNALASGKFNCPIYSIVIFLKKDSVTLTSPYVIYNHKGEEIVRFHFDIIKLWEVPTAVLFQKQLKGLLPLVPLTREGARREVVDEAIAELLKDDPTHENKDLLSILYGITSLVFNKQADKQWLYGRFGMLEDLLNESWAFRELRQRGEEAGMKQGMLKNLRSFVQLRFPDLLPLVEEYAQIPIAEDVLNTLVLQVGLAKTEAEAKQHLLTALHQQ